VTTGAGPGSETLEVRVSVAFFGSRAVTVAVLIRLVPAANASISA
jgi:hypothetical protein